MRKRGSLAKALRQSHYTIRGTLAATLRLWSDQASLSESEKEGLVNFLILTSAAHFEQFLVLLLRYRLTFPLMLLDQKIIFPPKKAWWSTVVVGKDSTPLHESINLADRHSIELTFETEQKMLTHVLEEWFEDLETSPFSKLWRTFGHVLGQELDKIVDAKALSTLFDLRNLIAHGRDAFIPLDEQTFRPKLHEKPLSSIILHLREKRLLVPQRGTGVWPGFKVIEQIFSLQVSEYFYRTVIQVEEALLSMPVIQKPAFGFLPDILPELPSRRT